MNWIIQNNYNECTQNLENELEKTIAHLAVEYGLLYLFAMIGQFAVLLGLTQTLFSSKFLLAIKT